MYRYVGNVVSTDDDLIETEMSCKYRRVGNKWVKCDSVTTAAKPSHNSANVAL